MHLLDNKDRVGCLLILLFSSAYLRLALDLQVDPSDVGAFSARTLPVGLALGAIVLSLVQIAVSRGERISTSVAGFRWRTASLMILAMALYSLLFAYAGFIVSSILFLLAGFRILGERRLIRSVAVAAGLVVSLWLLFTYAFGLFLDPGAWFYGLLEARS